MQIHQLIRQRKDYCSARGMQAVLVTICPGQLAEVFWHFAESSVHRTTGGTQQCSRGLPTKEGHVSCFHRGLVLQREWGECSLMSAPAALHERAMAGTDQ